ncbi:MBL fold metallo-hydrolase [Peptoniphilus equinus]|uniref:MBL fold metallo-hydrolase n=1 Tax=Peptoniphilus equinus TaxID=3016343 RepID=A0ABY7QT59_9FIRM|nr:MBL fold metallo-hydrolase [Peptoniphilus equinus]WBW49959.1 MBL fold metallo-hydrolase [Peptoniphilus equinus]
MQFCSLSSGSSGNCQFIEYKDTKILIDAGHSGKKITALLQEIGQDIRDIDAIFVSHEHVDHAKGVGVLAKKYGLKVFATMETIMSMEPITKPIAHHQVYAFENGKGFDFKDLHILPMRSFHDCTNGSMFVIDGDVKVSVATDTGHLSTEHLQHMAGSKLYYLEANHDLDMLMQGSYPWSLKTRIASTHGHLSNDSAAKVLEQLLTRQGEIVMLSHLSKDNNTDTLAIDTVRNHLLRASLHDGVDYTVEVSPRDSVKFHHLGR